MLRTNLTRICTHVLIWCLGTGATVVGQAISATKATTRKLSMEDGLPHREVRSTALDTNGLMWLSTPAGLVRYDGYTFTTVDTREGQFNGELNLGADGLLYCQVYGRPDSLEIYSPTRFEYLGLCLSPVEGQLFGGFFHRPGQSLYALWGSHVYRISAGEPVSGSTPPAWPNPATLHPLPSPTEPGDVLAYADSAGYLIYRPSANALLQLDHGEARTVKVPITRPNSFHRALDGTIYCLAEDGVYTLGEIRANDGWVKHPDLPARAYNYFSTDATGNLLIGYVHPLMQRAETMYLLHREGAYDASWIVEIEDRIISSRGQDFTQAITLATYGGVQFITFPEAPKKRFIRHMYDPEIAKSQFGNVMRGFTSDAEGYVYTNKDSRQNKWFRTTPDRSRTDTLIIRDEWGREVDQYGCCTNMVTVNGDIYGQSCFRSQDSTHAHLYRYTPSTDTWKKFDFPVDEHLIRYLTPDTARGIIWLATETMGGGKLGGLYQFDYRAEHFRPAPINGPVPGFRSYPRKVVLAPPDAPGRPTNTLYIGGLDGFYQYDISTGRLEDYDISADGPTRILDLTTYRDSTLLLATFGMGVYSFNTYTKKFAWKGGKITRGSVKRSDDFVVLPSDDVAGILVTPDSQLVITTFNGLVLYDKGSSSVYTTAEGLPNNEFNTTSLYYSPDNDDYFAGGVNGFVVFKLQDLFPDPSPYTPILVRYTFLDEEVGHEVTRPIAPHPTEPIIVPPSVVYFTLSFAVPDYSTGGAPQYETQLEGWDPEWRSPVVTPNMRYTRLPAGDYRFRLRALDANGRVTREMPPVIIRVQKPWYRRTWFYAFSALAIFSIIGLSIYVRFSRLQTKLKTQQRLHELKLRTLRQQMNPHFISNAMNAIREYIYNERPDQAAGYLTDFTRLMRLFLEASRKPATSIADETTLLQHYIRLEQLRFPDKFDYQIHVDENIAPEMDEIPSFVLQPIVENAINHGLLPLTEKGVLTISFYLAEDEETTVCEVTDNGIGRAAAAARASGTGHTSRSTQILEDRRSMQAGDGALAFDLQVMDLAPGTRHPGTRVVVTVKATSPA